VDVVEIRDLRVSAIVGLLPEERDREQPLSFDIDFTRPFAAAATSDDVRHTTNYATVITLTSRLTVEGKFLLLETLVSRVAKKILALDGEITEVMVRVRKLRPPVPQDVGTVGVSTRVTRG